MAKDTYYFSHDYNARNDPKIRKLISKHGMCGYGLFWAIVEDLYQNANALPTDYDLIAFDMRVDCGMVKSVINDFDLFIIDNNEFGSSAVERRLTERDSKSGKARESAFKRWNKNKLDANAMPTHSEPNAIKERKGKDDSVITDIMVIDESIDNNLNTFKAKFEIFKNKYPGTKKTLETEFENFKKKHKDWKQVLEILSESLDNQIEARRIKKAKGEFVPQWKMLSTYINNRAWEEVMPVDDEQLVVNSHSILRPTWESYYTTKTGASYFFDDKSLVALAEIEAKVKHSVAEGKNPAIPIEQAFDFILKNIKDTWVLSNLSLSVVNQKYNEIISNIKNNGKPGQQSLEQRYDDIKSIIGTMYTPK